MQKSYYAIIPADVRYDNNLTANAKLLYGEITALCNEKGFCWAQNSYFSELYSKSNETISRWISSLKEANYIEVKYIYKEGSKEIDKRIITLSTKTSIHPLTKTSIPSPQKDQDPLDKNVKDNTTVNNTSNIYDEKDFLEDWALCRKSYRNLPTNIKGLKTFDLLHFNKLKKDWNREEFRQAMRGLFEQEVIKYTSMITQPSHFLEQMEKYYNAFISKDFKQYGSKQVQH